MIRLTKEATVDIDGVEVGPIASEVVRRICYECLDFCCPSIQRYLWQNHRTELQQALERRKAPDFDDLSSTEAPYSRVKAHAKAIEARNIRATYSNMANWELYSTCERRTVKVSHETWKHYYKEIHRDD